MARAKKKTDSTDVWELYQSIQLTPEEKAAARERLKKLGEDAARKGVYKRFLALRGKVHMDVDFYKRLREEDD